MNLTLLTIDSIMRENEAHIKKEAPYDLNTLISLAQTYKNDDWTYLIIEDARILFAKVLRTTARSVISGVLLEAQYPDSDDIPRAIGHILLNFSIIRRAGLKDAYLRAENLVRLYGNRLVFSKDIEVTM